LELRLRLFPEGIKSLFFFIIMNEFEEEKVKLDRDVDNLRLAFKFILLLGLFIIVVSLINGIFVYG